MSTPDSVTPEAREAYLARPDVQRTIALRDSVVSKLTRLHEQVVAAKREGKEVPSAWNGIDFADGGEPSLWADDVRVRLNGGAPSFSWENPETGEPRNAHQPEPWRPETAHPDWDERRRSYEYHLGQFESIIDSVQNKVDMDLGLKPRPTFAPPTFPFPRGSTSAPSPETGIGR